MAPSHVSGNSHRDCGRALAGLALMLLVPYWCLQGCHLIETQVDLDHDLLRGSDWDWSRGGYCFSSSPSPILILLCLLPAGLTWWTSPFCGEPVALGYGWVIWWRKQGARFWSRVLGGRANNASGINTIFCTHWAFFVCVALGFPSNSVCALYHLFWSHVELEDFLKFEQSFINCISCGCGSWNLIGDVLILVC